MGFSMKNPLQRILLYLHPSIHPGLLIHLKLTLNEKIKGALFPYKEQGLLCLQRE